MTVDDFNASIRSSATILQEFGLLEALVNPAKLHRMEEFNKISLTSKVYTDVYEAGLALSHYNILLSDLAFFQFSHVSESEWALAFYPNPRVTGSIEALTFYEELVEERDSGGFSDEEFSALAQEMPAHAFVPRIRFEYSEKQYKPVRHPGAHMHIGMSGEDRWMSARKISPKSFAMIIVRHFYPNRWWNRSRFSLPLKEQVRKDVLERCVDRLLIDSLQRDGVSQFLTNEEKMGFHLTALASASSA